MAFAGRLRFAVKVTLLASAAGITRSLSEAAGAATPSPLDLDRAQLPPVIPEGSDPPLAPEELDPKECTYPTESGKDGILRLTTPPSQGIAFRCPEEGDFTPRTRGSVFRVNSDGSCDTSTPVLLRDIMSGFTDVVEAQGSKPSYRVFYSGGSPLDEDKQFCYVCSATRGEHAGKKCNIVITAPKAQLTNTATCGNEPRRYAVAAFSDDESDLAATFTCAARQPKLLPSLESKQAETGNFCAHQAALTEIAEGASLTEISTGAAGSKSYKLTLQSLPEKPRLFCFRCSTPGDANSRCDVLIYAPASKRTKQRGRNPDPGTSAVTTTTTTPASRSSGTLASSSSLYVSGVLAAAAVASFLSL
ncbi:sag-related sequence srs17b [Cystoisospora suis]|uniref:Sag-related sequence srs17b n=1 Tax=Cystoisospora suis TaxID=483139 RepID=A0A2C6LD95_9APIC|nr:sag-related sequence srs17b [Cystoisospora suis]